MSTTITALMAALIHEARTAEMDSSGVDTVAALLAQVIGEATTSIGFDGSAARLVVNGLPVTAEVPGASLLSAALRRHGTWRLDLPGAMSAGQWRGIGTIYSAGPGVYPSPAHVLAAVTGLAPGAGVRPAREGNVEPPDARLEVATEDAVVPDASAEELEDLTTITGDRAELSALLDPLLQAGARAVSQRDWAGLAEALTRLHEVERRSDSATRSIIVREQRRFMSDRAVTELVDLLPREGSRSPVARAVELLGRHGAEAIIDRLVAEPSRADRRVLLDVLARTAGIDDLVVRQVGSRTPALARDMAEIAERRRIETAVPALAAQLHHANAEVRTACWRALEAIGTVEALAALNRGR
jgi:hypothetical protein